MKKNLTIILILIAVWRLALFLIGAVAGQFFTYAPTFPYATTLLPLSELPPWLYSWANFDGVHYLTIIDRGYVGTALIQAFFPGYPFLVTVVALVVKNALLSGLLVSNAFAIATFIVWFAVLKREKLSPWTGLAVLMLFPTSFFLGALYSESLFLFLILSSFLAARQRQWFLASVLAGLASATRIVGIFLVPALVFEYLIQLYELHRSQLISKTLTAFIRSFLNRLTKKDSLRLFGIITLGSVGLLSYMAYLKATFNDPLYFFHVQAEFGAGRSESLIFYPQVIWRYLKILATYQAWDWSYFTYIQEFAIGVLGFLGLLASLKYVRFSYVFFSLAAFLLPTLTGTFSSMSRYTLVCVALFLLLTKLLHSHRWLLALYLVLSGMVLVINTMLFIQGYWVA